MEWEIHKDRPIPEAKDRRGTKSGYVIRWPWEDMEVGDSVDIPKDLNERAKGSITSFNYNQKNMHGDAAKHLVRKTYRGQMAVWRDK